MNEISGLRLLTRLTPSVVKKWDLPTAEKNEFWSIVSYAFDNFKLNHIFDACYINKDFSIKNDSSIISVEVKLIDFDYGYGKMSKKFKKEVGLERGMKSLCKFYSTNSDYIKQNLETTKIRNKSWTGDYDNTIFLTNKDV